MKSKLKHLLLTILLVYTFTNAIPSPSNRQYVSSEDDIKWLINMLEKTANGDYKPTYNDNYDDKYIPSYTDQYHSAEPVITWTVLDEKDDHTLYIHGKSIITKDMLGMAYIWLKRENKVPDNGIKTAKFHIVYDCNAERQGFDSLIAYDVNGDIIDKYEASSLFVAKSPVVPDTAMYEIMTAIC